MNRLADCIGSWGASMPELTRLGTMNAGSSPQIQGYRRFGFPPICGSPESAGKTSMVHGEYRSRPLCKRDRPELCLLVAHRRRFQEGLELPAPPLPLHRLGEGVR